MPISAGGGEHFISKSACGESFSQNARTACVIGRSDPSGLTKPHAGDSVPRICMFGEKVTPNQHKIAAEYALFDNLYCNSEVSVDGHAWCDAAIANDYNQRKWITHYSTHGDLPGNGETNSTQNGSIWTACRRNNVSFKCYGEGSWDVPSANRGTWTKEGQ